VFLPVLGCRTDSNLVMLENENRRIEDVTYQLKASWRIASRSLPATERENEALQKKLSGKKADAASVAPEPPDVQLPPASPAEENAPAAPPSAPATPPSLTPPPASEHSPPVRSAAHRNAAPGPLAARGASTNSRPVEKIVLDRIHTGGYRPAGEMADEGIAVLIEPRDADGRVVDAAAPVAVVLMDGEATARRLMWRAGISRSLRLRRPSAIRRMAHGYTLNYPGQPARLRIRNFRSLSVI